VHAQDLLQQRIAVVIAPCQLAFGFLAKQPIAAQRIVQGGDLVVISPTAPLNHPMTHLASLTGADLPGRSPSRP
jgi:hypothetical protein